MNEQVSYEADGFELDTGELDTGELDTELDTEIDEIEEVEEIEELDESAGPSRAPGGPRPRFRSRARRCRCGCQRCHRQQADAAGEMDQESGLSMPPWLNSLHQVYKAGRLGWKAGRFIDKASGKVLGKPISSIGADFLYQRLGRSRRLEDFFDRLPPRVKRWLNQF
jgi:hypothetical protein